MTIRYFISLLCLLFVTPVMAQMYTEDFTSDSDPTIPGFASSIFVHSLSGGYAFVGVPAPLPSPPHAMEIFNGADDITFALAAGQQVEHALAFANTFFSGGAQIIFEGSNTDVDGIHLARKTFPFGGLTGVWQSAEVTKDTIADQTMPPQPAPTLGAITKITLVGGEALYDSVQVDLTAGSPNPITAGVVVSPKKINVNSRSGLIRAAILTDSHFDALTIDTSTVQFGNATMLDHSVPADADADGDTDLVLFFKSSDVGITCGQTSVSFTAFTFTGDPVEGTGAIETICR